MKVSELMHAQPRICSPRHSLCTAGRIMVEVGCGALPVISADLHVVGVLTNRDIVTALVVHDRAPSSLEVRQIMSEDVAVCHPDDSLTAALDLMRGRRIRRLPVVADDGTLCGMLSLDDLALAAGGRQTSEDGVPGPLEIAEALQAICGPPARSPLPTTAGKRTSV